MFDRSQECSTACKATAEWNGRMKLPEVSVTKLGVNEANDESLDCNTALECRRSMSWAVSVMIKFSGFCGSSVMAPPDNWNEALPGERELMNVSWSSITEDGATGSDTENTMRGHPCGWSKVKDCMMGTLVSPMYEYGGRAPLGEIGRPSCR